ncbi:MAG: hypothetical protein PGN13_11035 [Patulibacter minatonensis]
MESSHPTQSEAHAALDAAARAQRRLVSGLPLPAAFSAWVGGAIAVHVATVGVAVAHDTWPARIALVLGLVQLLAIGWWQALAFRRRHGVWIAGLVDSAVLGVDLLASTVYAAAVVSAWLAAARGLWLGVAAAAMAGGAGYALAGRRWYARYVADPERYGRGLAPAVNLAIAAVALVGLLVLVLAG